MPFPRPLKEIPIVSRALDWDALCAYCYLPRRHRTRTERHELDCENIAVPGLELVQPIGSEGLPFQASPQIDRSDVRFGS